MKLNMSTKYIVRGTITAAFAILAAWTFMMDHSQPGKAAGEMVLSPRSLYVQNCAKCHGSDGRADTAKGRELDADDLTTSKVQNMNTAKLIRIITDGKGDMPGMGKKLTAAQIRSIAGYVRVF